VPPDETEEIGPGVEQTGLGPPSPLGRRKHAGSYRIAKDPGQVVNHTSQYDRLGTQSTRAGFGNDSVADLGDGPSSALHVRYENMAVDRLTGPMVVMLMRVWTINRAPMTQEVVIVS
jgi:hypothetical protein